MTNWICRTWTETSLDGWSSVFDRFESKDAAIEHGRYMMKEALNAPEILEATYEVYKA